jgi:hypothetical protein
MQAHGTPPLALFCHQCREDGPPLCGFLGPSRARWDGERAALILNPAQAAAEGATRERLERIGGHGALIIDWLDAAPLDAVPLSQLADRIVAFLRARWGDPQALISWHARNRHALREFWARAPADALGEKALTQDGKPPTT